MKNLLVVYRKKARLTQEEMGKKLGYKTKSGYCYLENGPAENIPLEKVRLCSEILGVPISELFPE